MTQQPVSDEIAAAFAQFFHGGAGPSHSKLSTAFASGGYGGADPYDSRLQLPNKETRVLTVVRAAVRRPVTARKLIEQLLVPLRVGNYFGSDEQRDNITALRRALAHTGWTLSEDGYLRPHGAIDLTTGGREALDEQLDRLRRATDDPGLLLGAAKDLLESVAKFVLEEEGMLPGGHPDFGHLWHLARERLGVLPSQVNATLPGGRQIRAVLQSSWTIAEQINELRGLQGTGHGRTLPTGVSAELALLMVREACSVAEFMLTTLDRTHGK